MSTWISGEATVAGASPGFHPQIWAASILRTRNACPMLADAEIGHKNCKRIKDVSARRTHNGRKHFGGTAHVFRHSCLVGGTCSRWRYAGGMRCRRQRQFVHDGGAGHPETAAAPEPKVDPVCVTLVSRIEGLRKEGVADKIEKAADQEVQDDQDGSDQGRSADQGQRRVPGALLDDHAEVDDGSCRRHRRRRRLRREGEEGARRRQSPAEPDIDELEPGKAAAASVLNPVACSRPAICLASCHCVRSRAREDQHCSRTCCCSQACAAANLSHCRRDG